MPFFKKDRGELEEMGMVADLGLPGPLPLATSLENSFFSLLLLRSSPERRERGGSGALGLYMVYRARSSSATAKSPRFWPKGKLGVAR